MLERFILGNWDVRVRTTRLTELSGTSEEKRNRVFYTVSIILFRNEKGMGMREEGTKEGRKGGQSRQTCVLHMARQTSWP